MPITKSAKKALRKAEKNRTNNLAAKTKLKKALKEANNLIGKKDKDAGKAVSLAYSLCDKAAKNKNISKQRAGRIKSGLAKALSQAKLKPQKREIVKITAKPKAKTKKAAPKKAKATQKKPAAKKKPAIKKSSEK